jgi:hypothetical protein
MITEVIGASLHFINLKTFTMEGHKYRKVLFNTNDRQYPFLFKREDNIYILIDSNGKLSGDGFDSVEHVLKYFPKAEL